jgi:glutamine synthetase
MFVSTGVSSEDEVRARYHVRLERYLKDIDIEVSTLIDMTRTQVLPAALAHQAMLAQSIDAVTRVKGSVPAAQTKLLDACSEEIVRLDERVDGLERLVRDLAKFEEEERARHYAYQVGEVMASVRESCDHLEETVADSLWPLPKYPEMLFLS